MSSSIQSTTDQRQYIQDAKEEAASYFSQKTVQSSFYQPCNRNSSSFYCFDFKVSNNYSSLSRVEQKEYDLREATFSGIVLFILGILGTQQIIEPFQKAGSLLQNDRIHLNSATLTKKETPHYYSIAQDLTEIHSLQVAHIQKHVATLFLLFYGSATLIIAGITAAPLLLPTGYTLITASLALAFFTELWHRNDTPFLDAQYKKISQVAEDYLQAVQ